MSGSRAKRPASAASAIGIDVGGTKIAGGIVLFPEAIVQSKRGIPAAPRRSGRVVLRDALRLARQLLDAAAAMKLEPLGIGVAVAELVDLAGNVASASTIPWRRLPIRAEFERSAPTVVEA